MTAHSWVHGVSKISRETLNSIINAIESVEVEFTSRGQIDAAIGQLNEIDKQYPGQYLVKIALAEAYLLHGDPSLARKNLFLGANLNPSDFRFELLNWLIGDTAQSSASGNETVIRKIERRGTDSFQYLLGLSHYLGYYQRITEQKALLRLLTTTKQDHECTQILLDACEAAELPDEVIQPLRLKLG